MYKSTACTPAVVAMLLSPAVAAPRSEKHFHELGGKCESCLFASIISEQACAPLLRAASSRTGGKPASAR